MAKHLQKLELTWIGKGDETKLEPRILIEDPSKSFGDPKAENMLIHGDNLLALKALEQNYTGKIKCIYIDPPYNTGSAFEHYDDGIEHSQWLSLMAPRLKILRSLLSEDGSIWISIDDNECHYLKVQCDEIFGRSNFLTNFIWKKSYGGGAKSKWFVGLHEHILVYSKNIEKLPEMFLPPDPEAASKYYKYKDEKFLERGPYRLQPLATTSMDTRPNLRYPINYNGHEVWPEKQWQWSKERVEKALQDGSIMFNEKKAKISVSYKQYLKDESGKERNRKPYSIIEGFYTQHGTYESMALFGIEDKFSFPKPEGLLQNILEAATEKGDIILDSFLGSGTSAAVATKMNRKWIGIELGEHATTHCLPRLQKVISGEDKGGVSESVNWKGGGGFKFYTLAPSLIQKDKYGTEIINPSYNPNMLAAAMAKQEGFRYSPNDNNYWKQGFSSEKDFIFTTTQFITVQMLDRLAEELQPGESLLVCCKSFAKGCANRHNNITIKKIPQMLLGKCEFGKDDYSFNIVNLPHDDTEDAGESNTKALIETKTSKSKKRKADDDSQPTLFK
jgi:adenine-specific DNA-methyltransferase